MKIINSDNLKKKPDWQDLVKAIQANVNTTDQLVIDLAQWAEAAVATEPLVAIQPIHRSGIWSTLSELIKNRLFFRIYSWKINTVSGIGSAEPATADPATKKREQP